MALGHDTYEITFQRAISMIITGPWTVGKKLITYANGDTC